MLITFEGIDGSGKSTQASLLAQYLSNKYGKSKIVLTREPGGTIFNDSLRNLILHKDFDLIDPLSEMMLFIAMRRDHFIKIIKPSLEKQKIVICDRFIDSTIAYQGYGYEIDIKLIDFLHNMVVGIEPDATFIMNGDIELCLQRAQKNKFEHMDLEFHQRVQQGFIKIANNNPKRCHLIDEKKRIEAEDKQSYTLEIQREKIITVINNILKLW